MATDLYRRILAFDFGDAERSTLMRKVWQPTPFVVDVWTDGVNSTRYRDLLQWCFDELGAPCAVIHGCSGRWQLGGATVHGWTWFGFAEEADMVRFLARWPAPDDIATPVEDRPCSL